MYLKKAEEIIKSIDINLKEDDILDLLKNEKRWPFQYPWGQYSVEVISEIGVGTSPFFRNNTYLDYDRWKILYDKGFTTIISNILDLNEDLRKLRKELYNEIGLEVNGNFYFSKPGKLSSFPTHSHSYDVMVKQIYGSSTWKVNDQKFKLKKGEVCIVPKDTDHAVIDKKTKKLSLTLNFE